MKLPFRLFLWMACAVSLPAADFVLRDGDTVAFLGDSITAARGYTKIVEHYTLMRFPERRVRFLNAGQGGDTAQGSLQRLERDVFAPGATVLTVAFGINDIGWGTRADDAHRQAYLDGIREIVTRSQKRGVRVFICSPAITAESPDTAEKGYLQRMADDGLALARLLGAGTIDVSRGMREIQRRVVAANAGEKDPAQHTHLHVKDGVHLNDLGQLAMGYCLLRGLGAPAEVSSLTVDASALKVVATVNCTVTGLKRLPDGLAFRRLDGGLPLNLGIFSALNHRWIPIPDTLNGYRLQVTGLEPGDYEVRAEGRLLGKYSAERLARGENIASATSNGWEPGGPWDAQSDVVKELVDARDKAWGGEHFRRQFNADHPASAKLVRQARAADDALVKLARSTAKPYPYRFEIRKAAPDVVTWPEARVDTWRGFRRLRFEVDGCEAWVVEPAQAAPGKPWTWCMEFPDAFTERTGVPELLQRGYHHLHLAVGNTFGSPPAQRHFDAFYQVITRAGLAPKGTLIAISRGGLYAYQFAARHPERVACLYGDAPVCDFKSWPGGKGKGKGSAGDWKKLLGDYGFASEAEALAWPGNPVDRLEPLARAGVRLIHVVGDTDDVVPVAENTAVVEERYRKLGGEIRVLHKPGVGHHPHGLDDPSPVVRFILESGR